MKSKKKNKYDIVIQPLTFGGEEYTIYIYVCKNIRPQQCNAFYRKTQKKIGSYLRKNHLVMKFYGINKFSV